MLELNLEKAISALNDEGIIIYPTETFYGIGCKISSEKAISSIFQAKRRLLALPLPTIVSDLGQVCACTQLSKAMQNDVEELAKLFWAGPLTLLLPAKKYVSALLTGGTGKIAVRLSSHPIAVALAKGIGEPIVSSSANISGKQPTACFEELDKELTKRVSGYINAAPKPKGGQASTIIDVLGDKKIKILRNGAISLEQLTEKGYALAE